MLRLYPIVKEHGGQNAFFTIVRDKMFKIFIQNVANLSAICEKVHNVTILFPHRHQAVKNNNIFHNIIDKNLFLELSAQ